MVVFSLPFYFLFVQQLYVFPISCSLVLLSCCLTLLVPCDFLVAFFSSYFLVFMPSSVDAFNSGGLVYLPSWLVAVFRPALLVLKLSSIVAFAFSCCLLLLLPTCLVSSSSFSLCLSYHYFFLLLLLLSSLISYSFSLHFLYLFIFLVCF